MEAATPIALDPRNQKRYYRYPTVFRKVMTPTLQALLSLLARYEFTGGENLPATGGVIVAGNHMTNFDVLPMQFALPREIYYMGKEELFRNPLLDWSLRQLGGFPVYRGANDQWAMQYALGVLQEGKVLGIFPEGKRTKGAGLRPAKTGTARLSLESGCPIVPVAIQGTQLIFHHFPARARLRVIVGRPIYPQDEDTHLSLTDRLMFALANMLPGELRGAYANRPQGF